jgi:methylenetetrahydrofolate dehydrogenase (NADP+)/methenyltetrahydrofolate cyclohydrolase
MIIDGREMAREVEALTKKKVEKLLRKGVEPGLATLLVGENPASEIYIKLKYAASLRAGIRSMNIRLPADTEMQQLLDKIQMLNQREDIHGILLQLPLPGHLDPRRAMISIAPEKDVDGFHPSNMGALLLGSPGLVPCTPKGIIYALDSLGVPLEGAEVVIVGHSNVVGKPLAAMMLNRNATVQVCHIFTKDLAKHTREGEILVVAAGVPGLIRGDMVREGAYVFDVGTTKVGDKVVGDVDFESVKDIAAGITPVPGGVGPLTVAMLISQTVSAAELSSEGSSEM